MKSAWTRYLLLWFLIPAVLAGCDLFKDDEAEIITIPEPVPRIVADSLFTVLDSGLKYYDLIVGQGDSAAVGDALVADYNAWLSDSTLIDSSVLRGIPATFQLSESQVILGWIEGIPGMRRGGERQLVVPPQLAYGEEGTSVVPGNETLIFEIKLY